MNITNKLTLRHLASNKGRTTVTTLGICVSVAMITAVFVALSSFINLFGEIGKITTGDWHAKFDDINYSTVQKLQNDSRISDIGLQLSSDIQSVQLKSNTSYKKCTTDILIGDSNYLKIMMTGDIDGKLPTNENEVALESEFLEQNKMKNVKVGDKITLTEGKRTAYDEPIIGSFYDKQEKFTPLKSQKQYTVTGIIKSNPAVNHRPIFRGLSSSEKQSGNLSAAIHLSNPDRHAFTTFNSIATDYEILSYETNDDLLASFLASRPRGFIESILPIVILVLALIVIASVMLIYNAFGMSLAERVRYLGMLASVGATKSQKRKSVYFEGILLGAVGIPVGIGSGIIGIDITLKAVGDKIISTGMINGITDANLQMKTIVPLWAVIGIIIISIFTIFISSFIPAQKASKITPIDAIRQQSEIKVKPKRLKSPKFIGKIFGYEGELAYKNLKRNGRKSRIITASIALSIVLFIICNYFCSVFVTASGYEKNIPYQLTTTISYEHKKDLDDVLDKMQDVKAHYTVYNNTSLRLGNKSDNTVANDIRDLSNYTPSYRKLFETKAVTLMISFIDDSEFDKLCNSNNIDKSKFYGNNAKCLLLNNLNHQNDSSKIFENKIIGKHIVEDPDFCSEGEKPLDLEVGGLVEYDKMSLALSFVPTNIVGAFVPYSQYVNVIKKDVPQSDIYWTVGIETDNHKQVCEQLTTVLNDNEWGGNYVADNVDTLASMNTTIFILQVFIYGFITLITLITVANIINTISTNIALRRREFAMLKSVGTTKHGFNKMVCLESLFYALKAIIFGVPISILLCILINKMLGETSIPYHFDLKLYLLVILAVFVLISLTMIYSVRKLKNDNIIETLKEDIS